MSRLPGTMPMDPRDWLVVDDAFAGQMALRDALLTDHRPLVLQQSEGAAPASGELLGAVLDFLRNQPGYNVGRDRVQRPDGVDVGLLQTDPLLIAARLVQEDLCIMQDIAGQHVLTAAALCFPSSWTLSEKFMRPLIDIHDVVDSYDSGIARRVQRLFDGIRPENPMWRANYHPYEDPDLFAPRAVGNTRPPVLAPAPYMRSERQTLMRLPKTRAVVFSIHTYMVEWQNLTPDQQAGLVRQTGG